MGLCPGSVPVFWRVTLSFLAGYFVSYLYRSINAIIGPDLVREFDLSAGGLGLLTGIYFFNVFVGMFSGQWLVGLVLNLWPQTATGYAPEAYTWALGVLWLIQLAGLAWLWRGRKLFA
jgi:hypothetical protein